jgi:hypothetical protein
VGWVCGELGWVKGVRDGGLGMGGKMYGYICIFVMRNGTANVVENGVYADMFFSWNTDEIYSL